ncbi:MAG: peptidase M1, partial [Flavobacterium sp.]
MKKTLLAIVIAFAFASGYSQTGNDDLSRIAESEMKSAYRLSNFSANQNTANYDVVYHRLDLTVNPAVQFISG